MTLITAGALPGPNCYRDQNDGVVDSEPNAKA